MSVADHRLFQARSDGRNLLRTAVALSTATMLGAVGISVANAEPSAPPAPSVVYTTADTVADIAALKQLKATYFQAVDAKDWNTLRGVLAWDFTSDTTSSAGPIIVGREPFIAFLKVSLGLAETHHQGFDPDIKVTSATKAEGVWRMEDVLNFGGLIAVHGYGFYHEKYEKADGKWVIKYSRLERTRIDLIDPDDGSVIEENVPADQVEERVREATE